MDASRPVVHEVAARGRVDRDPDLAVGPGPPPDDARLHRPVRRARPAHLGGRPRARSRRAHRHRGARRPGRDRRLRQRLRRAARRLPRLARRPRLLPAPRRGHRRGRPPERGRREGGRARARGTPRSSVPSSRRSPASAFRVLLLPDHATPCALGTHTSDPVPYLFYDSTPPGSGRLLRRGVRRRLPARRRPPPHGPPPRPAEATRPTIGGPALRGGPPTAGLVRPPVLRALADRYTFHVSPLRCGNPRPSPSGPAASDGLPSATGVAFFSAVPSAPPIASTGTSGARPAQRPPCCGPPRHLERRSEHRHGTDSNSTGRCSTARIARSSTPSPARWASRRRPACARPTWSTRSSARPATAPRPAAAEAPRPEAADRALGPGRRSSTRRRSTPSPRRRTRSPGPTRPRSRSRRARAGAPAARRPPTTATTRRRPPGATARTAPRPRASAAAAERRAPSTAAAVATEPPPVDRATPATVSHGDGQPRRRCAVDPEDAASSFGEGNQRRRRRRPRPRRVSSARTSRASPPSRSGEPIDIQGLLDLRDEGYGFLRTTGYLAGSQRRVRVGVAGPALRAPQGRLREGPHPPAGEQREVPGAAPRRRDQRHDARRRAAPSPVRGPHAAVPGRAAAPRARRQPARAHRPDRRPALADRQGPARAHRVAAEGRQDHDPQADRLRDRAQQPRGAPHGAARRRAARRGHRHAPPRAAGRGGREHLRPPVGRAHRTSPSSRSSGPSASSSWARTS